MTSFSDLIAAIARDGDGFVTRVSDDWTQGRTAYGGLSGALCVEGAQRALADLPPLRSAQFAFVGPATGQLRIRPTLLRRGKSTAFVGVDLEGEAGLATRALLCFGAARASRLTHPAPHAAKVPPPQACEGFFRHAPPPASLVLCGPPAPSSTLTGSIDILPEELTTDDGWWLVRTAADHVANGYSGQTMAVWNASGAPVAAARQNVAVFI
jgi:acyl-CoA thioesterase